MRHSGGSGSHVLRARSANRLVIAVALFVGLIGFQAVRSIPAGAIPAATWTQASPSTVPHPLQDPSMAFDTATSQLIMVGAVSGDEGEETWLWDGTNWDSSHRRHPRRPGSGPRSPTTRLPASCSCRGHGAGRTYLNDTWEWTGTTWSNITPVDPIPGARALRWRMTRRPASSSSTAARTGPTWTTPGAGTQPLDRPHLGRGTIGRKELRLHFI